MTPSGMPNYRNPLDDAAERINGITGSSEERRRHVVALSDSLKLDPEYAPPVTFWQQLDGLKAKINADPTTPNGLAALAFVLPEPPKIICVRELALKHKIREQNLDSFRIVLRKRAIKQFLEMYGVQLTNYDIASLLFSTDRYEEFFGKSISKGNNRTHNSPNLYTYAEILQRVGIQGPLDLPSSVTRLFEENNVNF